MTANRFAALSVISMVDFHMGRRATPAGANRAEKIAGDFRSAHRVRMILHRKLDDAQPVLDSAHLHFQIPAKAAINVKPRRAKRRAEFMVI
jgi:hypothetical protein